MCVERCLLSQLIFDLRLRKSLWVTLIAIGFVLAFKAGAKLNDLPNGIASVPAVEEIDAFRTIEILLPSAKRKTRPFSC